MLHAWLFWPFFFWPFHGLFTLLVLILVLSLIFRRRHYYYYGHPWYWGAPPKSKSDALATLEERYAKGEIQRDEYLQKKQDLGG